MLKYILYLGLVLGCFSSYSQNKQLTREEYIKKYYGLAISEMERTGVPASIKLAQGCWESSNGNSRLAVEANNHFGIKCKAEWKGKKIYHDDDAAQECFRKYPKAEDSYIDHSNFLRAGSRYSFLFQFDVKDYKSWAKGLKQAGYATDPTYADRLIKIIEDNKLYIYDGHANNKQIAALKPERSSSDFVSHNLGKTTPKHKIELRNKLRTIVVEQGDTYESISSDLGLKDWELYTYNDYTKGWQPKVNEIIYIEPKFKKADRKHLQHICDADDKMQYISQRYALKLKPLLKRNRMNPGEEPATGQIVYLRNKKPRRN